MLTSEIVFGSNEWEVVSIIMVLLSSPQPILKKDYLQRSTLNMMSSTNTTRNFLYQLLNQESL